MKPFAIADLFCGAGGTSAGAIEAVRALGYVPNLTAVNHWDVAIATHSENHPDECGYGETQGEAIDNLALRSGALTWARS